MFTLGIGGTIIFSLIESYKKQNRIINRGVSEIKKTYHEWFRSKENDLNFERNRYEEFNTAVEDLRDEFIIYLRIEDNISDYKSAQLFIFIIYIFGIFVLVGSDSIVEYDFRIFPIIAIIYISIMFYLFHTYPKDFIFETSREENSSSEKFSTIYESIDDTQNDNRR